MLITGAGFIAATQYAASALHYQRQLGSPLATIAGLRLYAPVELASVGQRLRRVRAGHLQHGKRYRLALPSRLAPGGSLRRGLGTASR